MTDYNPSFTLIEIDEETMALHNIKTYFFNLTEANKNGEPKWELLHDYVETYNMEDLSPDSFAKLADNILNDEDLARNYIWNKVRRGQPKPDSCDENCRKNYFCDMTTTEQWQRNECKGLEDIDFNDDPLNAIFNLVVSPWMKRTD